jgi:integrase
MPKSRKFVRIIEDSDGAFRRSKNKSGREIHGLSYARTSKPREPERGSYYTIENGKRKHLSADLAEAVRLMAGKPAPLPEWVDPDPLTPEQAARHDAGLPAPCKEKLSDCVEVWRDFKAEQGRTGNYVEETVRIFNELVSVVGNKPLNFLDQDDFEAFERYLNRTYDKRNDWYARRLKGMRAVLNHVAKKKKKWPLPAGWKTWFDAIERQPVVSSPTNKKKLPPELFKAMLAVCRKNAAIDVESMPKDSQADKARRNRAWERKRNAVQFSAILHLAAQSGFGPEDICGLQWSNFVLDTRLPYVSFPRRKSEWKTGFAIPRQIPLLPATVQALLTWQEYEKPNDYVFRNAQKGHWVQDKLSRAFRQIRLASDYVEQDPGCWTDGDQKKGDIWSFKHLRNIPGNVAHEAGIQEWVAGAILGHVPSTLVGKRYTDDPKPEMLLHLIQAIGNRYS